MADSPGTGWWFPTGKSNSDGWRFDVITLLAVIGESSVAEHSQAITASVLCMLPRIIPAPQAMLRANRPLRMPEVKAKMAGIYSGVVLDTVGFFANIIHPLDDLKPFAFRVLEIKHKDLNEAAGVSASGNPSADTSGSFLRKKKTGTGNSRGFRLPGPPSDAKDDDPSGAAGEAQPRHASNGETRASTMATGRSAAFEPDPEMGLREELHDEGAHDGHAGKPDPEQQQEAAGGAAQVLVAGAHPRRALDPAVDGADHHGRVLARRDRHGGGRHHQPGQFGGRVRELVAAAAHDPQPHQQGPQGGCH